MSPRRKSGLSPEMWQGDFGRMVPKPTLTSLDLRRARRWIAGHMSFWRWAVLPVEAPRPAEVAGAYAHPKRAAAAQRADRLRKVQGLLDGLFGSGRLTCWEVSP